MQKLTFLAALVLLTLPFSGNAEPEKESFFNLSLEELLDVSISIATGSKQTLITAPATASVITAKQIRAMGATSLDEVLETVPGLHVSISSIGLDPVYTVRGIQNDSGSHVQILLNGISITTPYLSGRTSGFHFPLQAVKQVEVIRGPGSAIYGADAFAGVINIITKGSNEIDGVEVGGRIESLDTQDVWSQYGGTYFNWDVAFSFEYQHTNGDSGRKVTSDLQTTFDGAFGTNASLAPGSLNTQFELYNTHLNLQKEHWNINLWSSNKRDSGTGPGISQALDPKGHIQSDTYLFDISYKNDNILDDWLFESRLSHLYNELDTSLVLFPPGTQLPIDTDGNVDFIGGNLVTFTDGVIGEPGRKQKVSNVSLNGIYSGLESHIIRVAAEFKYEDLTASARQNFGPGVIDGLVTPIDGNLTSTTGTPSIYILDTHRSIWAGSIQDEWHFSEDWHLTAGVRYDHYSDFGGTVNPRVALVWDALDSVTYKLLYGRAFRAPSFHELGNINNPVIIGNPDLTPEIIDTFEWVMDYHPTSDIRTALNVFYYEIDDLILSVPDSGATTATYQNARDQRGYGLEWEMQWQVTDKLHLNSNYAWQHSENQDTGDTIAMVPRQQFYLAADWEFLPHWNLHKQLNWVGKRKRVQGDSRAAVDDYLVADLVLTRENAQKPVNFSAGIKNIFDEQGKEASPESFPDDYPILGRSFFLEARVHF